MPVTRTSSNQARVEPFPTPSPPQRGRRASADLDTISLTSSDAESSTKPQDRLPKKKTRRENPQTRPRPQKANIIHPTNEIIEISSGDEDVVIKPQPTTQPSVIADFRRQISKIREENVKQKRDLERALKEIHSLRDDNQKLKALQKPDASKIVLDIAQLADSLDCEICTCRMWTPYILPNCGHTFCQSCLQEWFGATQAQFLAAHPDLPDLAHPLTQTLQQLTEHPHFCSMPYVHALIQSQMPPKPNYTCPTCREPVTSRPTEAFALKALIRTIAVAGGETVPKNSGPSSNKKGKASNAVLGPWDGFFPPRKP